MRAGALRRLARRQHTNDPRFEEGSDDDRLRGGDAIDVAVWILKADLAIASAALAGLAQTGLESL